MINNFKVPFLYRVVLNISSTVFALHQGGLKGMFKHIKYITDNAIFRFKFKHSSKFKKKILGGLTANNIMFIPLTGMFYGDEEFSLRNCVEYLNDEEKEKYKKQTLDTIHTVLKDSKVKDKEGIESIINMFGLDLLGVKIEDVMPKKTTRKRLKKAKVYSIPTPTVK